MGVKNLTDVSGYAAGNFLSAEELSALDEKDQWGIVLPGAEFRESDFGKGPVKRLYIPVRLSNDEEKEFNCNKTTAKELMDAWGSNTDEWVDKKIKFELIKQNVMGKLRDVIYGKPADVKKEKK